MNRCPLTYEAIAADADYSAKGLRGLSPRLGELRPFPYSVEEQVREAALRARHMSIQGVQPKLSVKLNVKAGLFEVVNTGGRYILKPRNPMYPELPENEDLSMRLAKSVGIDVPFHGLIRCSDGSRSYIIRRFDRIGNNKLAVEDFAQLSGESRETKYRSSVEKVAALTNYCTFPAVERVRLFRRLLFNFVIGNEDMHLKNFSLITRGAKTELAPAYDFLNTTAVFRVMGRGVDDIEESALPLNGKKRKLSRSDWIDYLAYDRLGLPEGPVNQILRDLEDAANVWADTVAISFLSPAHQDIYQEVITRRLGTIL
ncbi:MAG: HipA domain-containing protein [Lentisphaeria bacterium]|nr:HipA domain-containing protein [Lentisphaeria bacterium]